MSHLAVGGGVFQVEGKQVQRPWGRKVVECSQNSREADTAAAEGSRVGPDEMMSRRWWSVYVCVCAHVCAQDQA